MFEPFQVGTQETQGRGNEGLVVENNDQSRSSSLMGHPAGSESSDRQTSRNGSTYYNNYLFKSS